MSYTPTTWTTGDTITASAMNKIEQGIANAGGGGLAHYTNTSGTLDCTYNDLVADITAGRLPYISDTEASIVFGTLVTLDSANDYEAWFSGASGGITCFFNESADGYLVLAD